jgi:PHD/YefM family antitoxin component YafN of YafNO toxin-antitoxin module
MTMQRVLSTDAQNEFQFVMDQVCSGLGPVLITGMRGNAVLVCEEEWQRLNERLQSLEGPEVQKSCLDQLEQIVEAHTEGVLARD